jgi:cyclophilin family peptidyl-prolyl cis-trans isomerase
MNIRNTLLITFFLTLFTACSDSTPVQEQEAEPTPVVEGNDYLVTITTEFGEMKAILYDDTPLHKDNFLKLAGEGFYNDLLFHRVINGFMIQGGDPDSKTATPDQRLGASGPGYTIPAEFVPGRFHVKGALAAARQPDQVNPERASSGSQFYIVHGKVTPREQLEGVNEAKVAQAYQTLMRTMADSDLAREYQAFMEKNPDDGQAIKRMVFDSLDRLSEATGVTFDMAAERVDAYSTIGGVPFLDDQYTVFGRVVSGLEIIDQIAAVETGVADRPVRDVRMHVTVQELPRAEIVAMFGNPY